MRGYSIDLLIAEINDVIKHPNPETLRVSTILNVKHVLVRIGVEFTCQLVDDQMITVTDGKYKIDEDVVQIDDFGFAHGSWSATRMGSLQNHGSKLSYRQTPFEVIFPFFKKGDLIMRCYKMYHDEDGMPLIPADAYQACVHWCKYKAIDSRGDQNTQIWRERFVEKQLADREIYYSRALFNSLTSASQRNLNQAFTKGKNFY